MTFSSFKTSQRELVQGTGKPHPLPAGTRKYVEKKGGTDGEGEHHVAAAPDFEWGEHLRVSPCLSFDFFHWSMGTEGKELGLRERKPPTSGCLVASQI